MFQKLPEDEYEVKIFIKELDILRRTIQIGRQVCYYTVDKNGGFQFQLQFAGIEINAFDNVPDEYEQARYHFWHLLQ